MDGRTPTSLLTDDSTPGLIPALSKMDQSTPLAVTAAIGARIVPVAMTFAHIATSLGSGAIVEATAVSQNVHGVTVAGDLNVAARDVIQYHMHFHGVQVPDIPPGLKLVPNFRKIHIATLGRATPGTGLWIFVWETFLLWLDPDGLHVGSWNVWCREDNLGISIVINWLEAYAKASTKPVCVAYIYVHYSDHAKTTVRDLLEVLVRQTVERHASCLPFVNELYGSHAREETQPTEEELLHLLQGFTKNMAVTFYILDALDEAPTGIQLELIEKLSSLNVKLFITSRPMKVVQMHFPDAHCFPIVTRNEDLDLHIAKEISRSAELRALLATTDATWRDEIVSTIKRKAGGMFLHASLQLDALRDCTNIRDVKGTLKEFPAPIEDVYVQAWGRILNQPSKKASLATSALLWVLFAIRSLTVDELWHAVGTSPDTHRFEADRVLPASMLISLCRGLVTMEESSGLVRLVRACSILLSLEVFHEYCLPADYTAKDTLRHLIHQAVPHPHSAIAAVCMTHLVDCGFQSTNLNSVNDLFSSLQAEPLVQYAYHSWSAHAWESLDIMPLAKQLQDFIRGCHTFPVLNGSGSDFDILGPLHVAAFFDFPISFACSDGVQDPNLPTEKQASTPLCLACTGNSQTAVEELLQLPETKVNGDIGAGSSRSALWVAAMSGCTSIVSLLLKHSDIEVNRMDSDGKTLVMLFSSWSHYPKTILELLLAHPKTQVNLVNKLGWTALMSAS